MSWVIDPMIWVVKGDFPRRGTPMVGVFFAEGCYKGPGRGFFTRSGKATNFRESKFKLGMVEGESF